MTRIFLARHGESIGTFERRMESRTSSPLTSNGIEEVKLLASRLKEEKFHAIYTSPSGVQPKFKSRSNGGNNHWGQRYDSN
ncbi:histidine phosphatase family protein [Bacillus atrophaeus]|uniref:histidine phosphatase family protein n=1 Tax=Bacillus atrophaeus TaxID=1452 RepID=UPI002DDD73E2|nr:histidine phosphatase family protein [Bacillus atrophaeus]